MAAIDGRTAHRLFMAVCQFPAMRSSWLSEVVKGSPAEVRRHLRRFVETGLVAVFEGRHYLSELGMKRAANVSRVLPGIIKSCPEPRLLRPKSRSREPYVPSARSSSPPRGRDRNPGAALWQATTPPVP